MKNFLAKERWNKGLSGDPRCKGHEKGHIPHNARKCRAIHIETNNSIEAVSRAQLIKDLKLINSSISGITVNRAFSTGKTIKQGWKFEWIT